MKKRYYWLLLICIVALMVYYITESFDGNGDYISIDEMGELFSHANTYQNIPTYDGSNQSVHPDIYFNASGWNNWKYWMVMTPYPNSNSAYENPSILVSNDGSTWNVPDGLSNPIDPQPASGFNSDTDIINVNGTLWVYYRWNPGDGSTSLRMRNSTNGTSWSDEYEIFNVATSGHFASPSVVYKDGLFKMWAVNTTADSIIFYNSSDGMNWNGPYSTNFFPSFPGDPWHTNVDWIEEENEYWMVYNGPHDVFPIIPWFSLHIHHGSTSNIYFANSSDGITWQTWRRSLLSNTDSGWDAGELYRVAFLYNLSGNNILELWYSAKNKSTGWHIGYTSKSFSKSDLFDLSFSPGNQDSAMNVPVVGVIYQSKMKSFLWMSGQESRAIDIKDISFDKNIVDDT